MPFNSQSILLGPGICQNSFLGKHLLIFVKGIFWCKYRPLAFSK